MLHFSEYPVVLLHAELQMYTNNLILVRASVSRCLLFFSDPTTTSFSITSLIIGVLGALLFVSLIIIVVLACNRRQQAGVYLPITTTPLTKMFTSVAPQGTPSRAQPDHSNDEQQHNYEGLQNPSPEGPSRPYATLESDYDEIVN